MSTIVFTALGSLGDLHPMLPVAARLKGAGHRVTFAVPPELAQVVEREGLRCATIPTPQFVGAPQSTDPAKLRAQVVERLPTLLGTTLAVLRDVCRGADVIVTHPHQLASAITARKLDVPWVTLTVYPGLIPSAYTVPEPHWLPPLPTGAGRLVNRATWRIFRFGLRHLSGDILDAAVAAEGLERDDEVFMPGGISPHLTLVMTSPAYSPRQPDWPDTIKVTGYTPWDEPKDWREPRALRDFATAGEAPVLVTTSSAGERDATAFFTRTIEAFKASGRRAILLLGRAAPDFKVSPGAELAPGIQAWPYVPLSHAVPLAGVVVHHAGVGTTLTTTRYGRPSIAVPAMYDQWYNAGRIRKLGLGRVVEWKHFDAVRLEAALAAVAADPGYRERAEALGARIAREDGAGRAAEEITSLAAA